MSPVVLYLALCAAGLAQESAYQREMAAGEKALADPETAAEAEPHFRSAAASAATPLERANALDWLGLTLQNRNTQDIEALKTAVEPLYLESIQLQRSHGATRTRDFALALELHAGLLDQTGRSEEAATERTQAAEIRKALFGDNGEWPPPGAYRVGSGITAPRIIEKKEPEYDSLARAAKRQATVVVNLLIDEQGQPARFRLVRSAGLGLDEKALAAVREWRFEPATKDGKPVPILAQIEVNFRLL